MCQVCNILAQLVAIKRELSELLIFVGQGLVVRLELLDFVLRERDDINIASKGTTKVPSLLPIAVLHHGTQSLHHAEPVIVSSESQRQFLRLAIVVEQLLVLVTEAVDHVFVLQCALRERFESLGSFDSSSQKLRSGALLKHVLLVTVEELPFVEGVTHVGLSMLLSVRHELEPMTDDLSELDKASPPVKHFRLQVVVRAIPVLHSSDTAGEELIALFMRALSHVIHLVLGEAFVCHEFAQVVHLELLVEDLLSYRSNLVYIDHCLLICGLFLPFIEAVSNLCRDEVSKHDLLLFLNDFIPVDLPPHMRVVLQKFALVDFAQNVANVSRGHLLFAVVGIELCCSKVLDHLEGALQLLRIERPRRVR